MSGNEQLTTDQTSYRGTIPLQPGTYHLHVSACPASSSPCAGSMDEQWSNILSFTVAQPKPPPDPPDPGEPGTGPLPALKLSAGAVTVERKSGHDVTRFTIRHSGSDPENQVYPTLILERAGKRRTIDLEIESDSPSNTNVRFDFEWECENAGFWRWTVRLRDRGRTQLAKGSFRVPRCLVRRWFVSRAQAVRTIRGDFPGTNLRCSPAGPRRGASSSRWSCRIVRRGFVCRGRLVVSFSRLVQGGEVIESNKDGSGGVECRGRG